MKIDPVVAELFHVDGGTDRQAGIKKLIVDFRNFENVSRKAHTQFA
jgi:hypothetical protein